MALTAFGSRISAATAKASPPAALIRAEGFVGVEVRLAIDADQRPFGRPAGPPSPGRFPLWRPSRGRPCQRNRPSMRVSLASSGDQKMAIGFQGQPVAPGRRSGSPTTMNSRRCSSSQALGELLQLKAVGDQHAHRGELQSVDGVGHSFDIARNGLAVPIRRKAAIRRSCIQGTASTCRPALPWPAGG